jgi:hypothetical protein
MDYLCLKTKGVQSIDLVQISSKNLSFSKKQKLGPNLTWAFTHKHSKGSNIWNQINITCKKMVWHNK